MSRRLQRETAVFILASLVSFSLQKASADVISPQITDKGEIYSEEAPNTSFYGTGIAGRETEASVLRFEGDRMIHDGDLDNALVKLGKSVQLDPGSPEGHFLLAKAMTGKVRRTVRHGQKVDAYLLRRCIKEWKLLYLHDADMSQQYEARNELFSMSRLLKRLQKKGSLLESAPPDDSQVAETDSMH